MPTRGRPSKCTPEVVAAIVTALTAGNTRRAAAAYGGIDETTLCRWMRRFANFASSVTQAEAKAEVSHVANVAQAARAGDWRASTWWLERRRHAEWGKIDRLEIEIRETAARVAAQTGADPDWLVRRASEIAEEAQMQRGERS